MNEQRPDPDELATLAAALRSEARRAGRRGRRRVVLEPGTLAVQPPPARSTQSSTARNTQTSPVRNVAQAPARTQSAAPARPERVASPGPSPADLRVRAAGCASLDSLRGAVATCTACGLASTRRQTVFADGTGRKGVLFVGEAPGADEDASGVPFVGAAGRLLTDIITKGMGLTREDVYIANVLKCRPPDNRDPAPMEKELCGAWLARQIELVDPRVIIPLGAHAACHVLGVVAPIGSLRGRVHELGTRRVVPTYHPAFLLRSPSHKPECWRDIQLAMTELGLERPGGGNRP